MAHSYRAHYFHLVWSTKERKGLITNEIQNSLYKYIGGIVKNHNGKLLEIGGMPDHMHMLISLDIPDKFTHIIRDLKSKSSSWINRNNALNHNFFWQDGYGSFSVSQSSLEKIKKYIRNQQEHHKTITFEIEFEQLLKRHNIDFDHQYIFG